MTFGYPSTPSALPGETLYFHVSTDAPEIRIEVYRCGATFDLVARSAWFPGERFPSLAPYDDWSRVWRGRPFRIPADWPSGAYVAVFVERNGKSDKRSSGPRRGPDGRSAKALFVVRSPAPRAPILYKIPLFTYAAYNAEGDPRGSLYTWPGRKVTLHRPGNGTGGTPWDADVVDYYDRASPRQTFAHWDAKFIRWLAANGYAVDFATDLDIHRNEGDLLSGYRLLLSVGHDEYWSDPMRDHVESFVAHGGNVAFFSGNVSYWRVVVEDDDTALVIDKRIPPDGHVARDQYARTRPENTLTGVAYRNAGGQWNGPRPSSAGYTVKRPEHWIFAGTGLSAGAVFGEADAVVGYEADGAAFTTGPRGLPITTGGDCSPLDFQILATCPVAGWEGANAGADSTATMGIYGSHGLVFTAATTDWARVLEGGDAVVDRITRNVLDALSARAVRISGPFPTRCGRAVPVEGERGTFYVDLRPLSPAVGSRPLSYRWSVSAGSPGPLDGPTLDVVMPSPPVPVTITVSISADGAPAGFGSSTIDPYTRRELSWFEALCEIAQLGRAGVPPERAPTRAGEGAPCLSADLYDPLDPTLPFYPRPAPPPTPSVLRAMLKSSARLVELTRSLMRSVGRKARRSSAGKLR